MAVTEGDKCMPIAVIGLACRFPGDATSPEKLWQMLSEGRSAWSEFPKDRINIDGFYHPGGERQGTINFRGGHFLKQDVAAWDAPFFSMTAQEAAAMDPQQRILLEVSYEALENAGVPMETLPGSPTSVYCGSFVKDYEQVCLRDPDDSPMYAATGNGIAIMSNRVSWFYDLRGPSMTLDTGCSASLVGVSLACQSLRTGESKMAIAMGAGLILTPSTMLPMTSLGFLSADGKCFTFDQRANGYGRGEGIGAVILKPLADALRDNDTIRAVIRGSGVNQDGRTPGITMPSMEAQAANIRAVYASAGLTYEQTAYFEAHGTGTQAGDPIELGAIGETFATARSDTQMFVGSVKTNIGHLEGCAGIAGLIKSVLMLEKAQIPPNLWFQNVNPRIKLDEWNIKVPTELTNWPLQGLRRISVNCFGFGGTNSHLILDDAYNYLRSRGLRGKHCSVSNDVSSSPSVVDSGVDMDVGSDAESELDPSLAHSKHARVFVLSAHEQSGINRISDTYAEYVSSKASLHVLDFPGHHYDHHLESDLAYTLGNRRSVLPWKSFVVASSTQELQRKLKAENLKAMRATQVPHIAFIFSGQGAQWYAMGRELSVYSTYLSSLQEADAYFKSLGSDWSLMEELAKDSADSLVNLPYLSQPLCTAIQVALVELLSSWGIEPYAVAGHSSGEIAAAYCIGALSREDAWKAAYHRGRLTQAMSSLNSDLKGGMIAVALSEEEVAPYLAKLTRGKLIVACINSPCNVTVSGDLDAIHELQDNLDAERIFARKLKVENAYHSWHMRLIESEYLQSIADITPLETTARKMYSSVTGKVVTGRELGADYWARNLVSPVRFSDAIQNLVTARGKEAVRPDVLLEIGPHAALQSPLQQILEAQTKLRTKPATMSMLSRGKDAAVTALQAVGELWMRGAAIKLRNVNELSPHESPKVIADMPTYPWNHSKIYWHESHLNKAHRFRKYGRQDLIGAPTADSISFEPRWRGFIRVSENPWVQDHQIQNVILYPAAGMFTMVLEAACQMQDASRPVEGYELTKVNIGKAMIVPPNANGLETALNIKRHDSATPGKESKSPSFDFTIYTWSAEEEWQSHCTGVLTIHYKDMVEPISASRVKDMDDKAYVKEYAMATAACSDVVSPRQLYETLESIGLKYGPLFQNITSIRKKNNISCTTIRIPDTESKMPHSYEYPHFIHPATLDALFQTIFVAGAEPMLPSSVDSLYISADIPKGAGSEFFGHTKAVKHGLREAIGTVVMSDKTWSAPKIVINGFHCTALLTSPEDVTTNSGFLPNNHKLSAQLTWEETQINVPKGQKLITNEVMVILPQNPSDSLEALFQSLKYSLECINISVSSGTFKSGTYEDKICLVLAELDMPIAARLGKETFDCIKRMTSTASGVLWVTQGGQMDVPRPSQSTINGLFRTLRSENSQKLLYTIDLDVESSVASADALTTISSLLVALFSSKEVAEDPEYVTREGKMFVPRLVLEDGLNTLVERGGALATPKPMPFHQADRPLQLEVGNLGRLDTLRFNDDTEACRPLGPHEVRITVRASSISLPDVQTALGQSSSATLGFDATGIISEVGEAVQSFKKGDKVVAFTLGAFKSVITSHYSMVRHIPAAMSFETAASIPTSYMVAYHSLVNVSQLQEGDSILIHRATGGVGQAAVQIASHLGAEIFATVSTVDKQAYLTDKYGIPQSHIFDSHSSTFAKGVLRMTDGRGVDVVLNSLTGDGLKQSWACIGEMGHFIELGKHANMEETGIENAPSLNNVSYVKVDMESMYRRSLTRTSRLLSSVFNLFERNVINRVEPISVYSFSDITAAFRSLQSPDHVGKVVLSACDDDLVPVVPRDPHPLELRSDATYLLVGGLGGLGRSLTRLMIDHGARNIVYFSRSGTSKPGVKEYLQELSREGVTAKAYACDIQSLDSVRETLTLCQTEMPPIRGAVQAAAVIRDAIFDNMSWEDWSAATRPKIDGSWNLHLSLPQDLDFLVFLSSSTGIIGARGQANYVTGNVFQDALCQHRRALGLPAVSLDLGMILGAGMVAEDEKTLDMLRASGFFGIREQDFLILAKCAMTGYSLDSSPVPAQVIIGTGTGGLVLQNDVSDAYWYRDAKFSILKTIDLPSDSIEESSMSTIKGMLSLATTVAEATDIITTGMVTLLAKALNMLPEDIDASKPANAYGVDSLVAVGTRNWMFRETGVDCSVFEILSEVGIRDLCRTMVSKCQYIGKDLLDELEAEADI